MLSFFLPVSLCRKVLKHALTFPTWADSEQHHMQFYDLNAFKYEETGRTETVTTDNASHLFVCIYRNCHCSQSCSCQTSYFML